MAIRIQIIAIAASLFVILLVIQLIRRRQLREEYSVLWLIGSVVLIVFALWRDLLDLIANAVGVYYAPTVLLLTGLFFGALMFLHFSVVISRHKDQAKTMAQEIALLKARLADLGSAREETLTDDRSEKSR